MEDLGNNEPQGDLSSFEDEPKETLKNAATDGPERGQFVQVVPTTEAFAMDPSIRRRMQIRAVLSFRANKGRETQVEKVNGVVATSQRSGELDNELDQDGHELGVVAVGNSESNINLQQYRLQARRIVAKGNCLQRLGCASTKLDESTDTIDSGGTWYCFNPNTIITTYLHWTFRTSFAMLFLSSVFFFFFLTVGFAFLIYFSSLNHPECIVVGDAWNSGSFAEGFADAYALSWTTFSTVGYGLIYPATSADHPDQRDCVGVTILCSFESFVGVLFASFCGAILFGKVVRIQSHAQVVFSDPIVIRYGSGVGRVHADAAADEGKLPCPILEFRICNRLHDSAGGEIMDATLNCVAATSAKDAGSTVRRALDIGKTKMIDQLARGNQTSFVTSTVTDMDASTVSSSDKETDALANATMVGAAAAHTAVDEDTSNLVPRRIFSKMELESSSHPFFKRVWLARHVLNADSPLLTNRARRNIRKNGGFWPTEWRSHNDIRDNIRFNQLIVSLSGTCNVNAASVYAQKTYEFSDVNIGYQFVNVLYREQDDPQLRVDIDVINDVMEQTGGGGEPFPDLARDMTV